MAAFGEEQPPRRDCPCGDDAEARFSALSPPRVPSMP